MLNQVLRNTLGLEIRRVLRLDESSLYPPDPLSAKTVSRVLYFNSLILKVKDVEGTVVECGVGKGRSLMILAVLSRVHSQDRMFYGFDTFQGFPEPTEHDGVSAAWVERHRRNFPAAAGVRQFLRNSLLDDDLIDSKIRFIPGLFGETMSQYDGGGIALLHLDCDLYQSYLDVLTSLYDHVVPGGVIAFDEYQVRTRWRGARKAIDEFFHGRSERIKRSEFIDRYYTIKVAS